MISMVVGSSPEPPCSRVLVLCVLHESEFSALQHIVAHFLPLSTYLLFKVRRCSAGTLRVQGDAEQEQDCHGA